MAKRAAADRKAVTRTERTYTDAEKAAALALCDLHAGREGDHDKGVSEAARVCGIPRSTLQQWHEGRHTSADVPQIRQETKSALVSMMTEAVANLVGGLTLDKIQGASLVQITTAAGTLTDKALLLSGEATQRTDNRNMNLSARYTPPPP